MRKTSLCIPRSRTRILLMEFKPFSFGRHGVSLDSAPGALPMDSSALQWPPLPLSLSLGRSPDSHAREKACMHTNLQIMWSTASQHAEWTSLHRTAPHRTARQTAPKITLLHTINSLPCSHRACAFFHRCNWSAAGRFHALRCMWQSEAWRARRVRDFGAGLEVSMKACYVASMPP